MAEAIGAAYGVAVAEIAFLPLGADPDAAAWRVEVVGGPPCFLKTRLGRFDPHVLAVPRFLRDSGIAEVVAPLPTRAGGLSVAAAGAVLILYPFIDAVSGFETPLTRNAWAALGGALRRLHAATLPDGLTRHVGVETFDPVWRDRVRAHLESAPVDARGDEAAAALLALLAERREDVVRIVTRAEELARLVERSPTGFVLCHTDIHAGNVLVDTAGTLHIVDWDSPRYAPKERDLMFIGGGVGGTWNAPWQSDAFYDGYGTAGIDPVALAYYRYERIAEDIAVTCEQVLFGDGADRKESLAQLAVQWRPDDVIAIADATYDRLAGDRVMR
jgi:spectinomycin phosphotransferase